MNEPNRTLADVCANLFLFLTTFRRNAATSKLSPKELHDALDREFAAALEASAADARLRPQFERMTYPLVATADQVVLTSQWPHRQQWSVNLLETRRFRSAEGGKRFYKVVEEVLADPSDAAREMAEILFTCMGIGFQGQFARERTEYERHRQLLFDKARLPPLGSQPLAPDCYGRNFVRPVARLPTVGVVRAAMVTIGVVLLAALLVWAVARARQGDLHDLDRAFESR